MLFERIKKYIDILNEKNRFLLHTSWAVEIVYEQIQLYPSADWSEVVKRATEVMVNKFGLNDNEARSHVVYALRQEGAFVVPPRIMHKQTQLRQEMEGGI